MPVGRVFFLALALTLANVVLLLAGTASAQSTDDPIEIPTVRVGGKRVVDDAAPSTVIDRSEVREALPTIPDLLHQQPGMRVSRVGGLGSFTTVSIRGSTSEQVRVFVDGIPLDTADGGVVDFTSIPFGPIETIAIYRGVSPLLFGGSAIGGVISMQTRDIGEPHLEVEAGGGSFGTRQARAFYGDGGAGWGVGISLDYTGSQGDFGYLNDNGTLLATSSTDDDVETTRTNAEFDQVATMAKARFHLGGSWQLRALNLLTWQQNGLPGNGTFPTDETSIESIRNISGIRVEGRRIGDFPFETAFGAWLGYTETRLMDPIAEFGILKDDTLDTILAPGASLRLRKNIAFDDELQWSVRPAVSVDYRYEKFSPENTAPGAKVGRESDRHSVSFGGELSTLLGPIGTELIGSGRWERVWSTLENPGSVTGTVITPTDQKADDEFTWRVGLVQRSIPSTELTFNYAASVRFPSLYELFGNTGNVVGNPRLAAEEGTTMDAGIVHSADWLPDGNTWNLQLHIFQTKMTNLIQFAQNSQGVARAENVDSVELLGIEIGTYADVLSHLRVRGSMSWMETENTGEIKARKGKQLARRPRWQTFARLEGYHDFGRKSVGEVGLWVDVEHITGNFQDNANLVELPERTLMGVGAYAEFWDSQLRVDVTVRNLTDSRVQDFSGFPLPGVSALASLRYVPKL